MIPFRRRFSNQGWGEYANPAHQDLMCSFLYRICDVFERALIAVIRATDLYFFDLSLGHTLNVKDKTRTTRRIMFCADLDLQKLTPGGHVDTRNRVNGCRLISFELWRLYAP